VDTPAPVDEPSVVPTDTVISYGEGDLLVWMDARPGVHPFRSFVPVSQVWIYDDGRVIVRHELGYGGSGWGVTPLLESRLSPEGVDLVRSELLGSGLFEADANFSALSASVPLAWGSMLFDDGTTSTKIHWCCFSAGTAPDELSDRQERELVRITEGLADMEAWLPPSAWDDGSAEAHVYTPASYAICFWQGRNAYGEALHPSAVLDALPVDARRIMTNSVRSFNAAWTGIRASGDWDYGPFDCAAIPIDDAVNLERILSEAGATRLGVGDRTLSGGYLIESDGEPGKIVASFEPILPHGTWSIMGG
jgi:hypothetical protein